MGQLTSEPGPIQAAIVDYGLGNLFSVENACKYVGILPSVTSSAKDILAADLVILPGVGAYADAMDGLKRLDLVEPIREVASSNRPLMGICLGMQLLMTESHEFGRHQGLGIIEGEVVRLDEPRRPDSGSDNPNRHDLKVPHVGWNRIFRSTDEANQHSRDQWADSPLEKSPDGMYMYFVHSLFTKPVDPTVMLSKSQYGGVEFCSSLRFNNVFACQFHPERSGSQGLNIYRNIARSLNNGESS